MTVTTTVYPHVIYMPGDGFYSVITGQGYTFQIPFGISGDNAEYDLPHTGWDFRLVETFPTEPIRREVTP